MRNVVALVVVLLLIACGIWTESGRIFVANVSAKLGHGAPTTRVDFDVLHSGLAEADVQAFDPGLDWQCNASDPYSQSSYGERACGAPVSFINGVSANQVDYMFGKGSLTTAVFEFSPDSFPNLEKKLDSTFRRCKGDAVPAGGFPAGESQNVQCWKTGDGMLFSSTTPNARGNVFASWFSDQFLTDEARARRSP